MGKFRINKFDGVGLSTLGMSINQKFTPDMDLRTVGYWDATRADKQTVVTSTNNIPKLTALEAVVGPTITAISATRAPASQDASGSRGVVWRSDSGNEGVQALNFPAGMLPDTDGDLLIGVVLSQESQTAYGRLLEFSADGTDAGRTLSMQWSVFNAPNNYVLMTQKLVSSNLLIPNYPQSNGLHCLLFHRKASGEVAVRMDGVQIAEQPAAALVALLPAGGTGSLGGGWNGGTFGIDRSSNTRLTHLAIATMPELVPTSDGSTASIERDRNAAAYWEASLMWEAGIQSNLPTGHPFQASRPVTTWVGERT